MVIKDFHSDFEPAIFHPENIVFVFGLNVGSQKKYSYSCESDDESRKNVRFDIYFSCLIE